MAEDSTKFAYLLAGIGIGTVIGVLFAPRSGNETREFLSDKANEGTEFVKRKGREVCDQADHVIAKGKETLQRQRENVEAAVEAGKKAYREAVKPAGSEG